MNLSSTSSPADQDPQTGLAPLQLQELQDMVDVGMVLVRHLRNLVFHPVAPEPVADFALGYARLSHSIRQSIALQAKLAGQGATPASRTPPTPRVRTPDPAWSNPPDARETAKFTEIFQQRLNHPAFDPARQSVPDLIRDICASLNIAPHSANWPTRLIDHYTAQMHQPGAPSIIPAPRQQSG